jgi:hypothetical protein
VESPYETVVEEFLKQELEFLLVETLSTVRTGKVPTGKSPLIDGYVTPARMA